MTRRTESRRRPGWLRRWIVRPVVWSAVLLLLLTALLVVYMQSDAFARAAVARAETWVESRLGRDVSAGAVEIRLLPLTVEVRDLEIAAEEASATPFVRAERVLVDATVGSFVRPGVRLDGLRVEGLEISLRIDDSGRHDGPRWSRRRGTRAVRPSLQVEIGFVEVSDGLFLFRDERHPLDFRARNLSAELTGGVEPDELRGRAVASAVELELPRAAPYLGEMRIDGSYRPGRFELRQGQVTGPDLDATASGIWRWRESKDLDLRIVADARLELLDRLGVVRNLGKGPFHIEGSFRRLPGAWFVSGDLEAPSLELLDRRLSDLVGTVSGGSKGLRFEIDSARYGSGSLSGSVDVPLATADETPVDVELELNGVALARLLADQGIPLDGLAGDVSGAVHYEFQRSEPRRGNGWADLEIKPGTRGAARALRVSGDAPLSIGSGIVRSEAIRLASDAQLLLAEGHFDLQSATGSFDYLITTSQIAELVGLLPLGDEEMVWRPSAGAGTVEGRFEIAPQSPRAEVRLDLTEVEASGYSAGRMHGGFNVDVVGIDGLRLELSRPEGAMIVTASVPFSDGGAAAIDARPFHASVDAVGWPLEDVEAWLPWKLPLGGDFSGSLELVGGLGAPSGRVEGKVAPLRRRGLSGPGLALSVDFDPGRVSVRRARLELADGFIDLSGEVDLTSGGLDLGLESSRLRLETLPVLVDLPGAISGALEMTARLEGSLDRPRLEGRMVTSEVLLGGDAVGAGESGLLAVGWDGRDLEVSGSVAGLFTIDGRGQLADERVELALAVETDRLERVASLLAAEPTPGLEGSAAGMLRLSGPLSPRPRVDVTLELERLTFTLAGRNLHNLEPVMLALAEGALEVRALYLGEPEAGSELFARGRVAADGLDLDLQASLAGDWFNPLLSGVEVRGGRFDVIGRLTGSPGMPRFNGVGEARQARVAVDGFPHALEGVNGVVLFYPRRLVLENGAARVAGGDIRAGGTIQLPADEPPTYRLQVVGEDLSFRYPEGWLVRGDSELTVASTDSGRQISGSLRLDRAVYVRDVPLEIAELLRLVFERRRIEAGDVEGWRSETALDLEIETADGLRVRNNLADLTGSAELAVRGSLSRPVVFGNVSLGPGGRLVYGGRTFTLERGSLTFANPYRVEPVIDLVASIEMREYDVTLSLSGSLDRLRAEFVSDPPLAELEVLALLTGGRDPSRKTTEERRSSVDSVAAESFLYGQATSLIASRFNRLFGLDQFRLDPLTGSSGDLSSARVTVGKRLSRDVSATYSYDPSASEEQILELEWSISRSLVLVVTQNGDGSYAVDARWDKAL